MSKLTTNRYPGITDKHVAALVARKPFVGGQSMGYVTKGGTYVVATPPLASDSGRVRDLFVIMWDGTVIPLIPTANPEPLERILRESREAADKVRAELASSLRGS